MQFESSKNCLSKSCLQVEGVDLGQNHDHQVHLFQTKNFITDIVHQIDKEHSVPIKDSKFLQVGIKVEFINGKC